MPSEDEKAHLSKLKEAAELANAYSVTFASRTLFHNIISRALPKTAQIRCMG
jgi:hypothetical protein